MLRHLFATTAIAALMTTGALAQETKTDTQASDAPATMAPFAGDFAPAPDQLRASEIIGMTVYNSSDEELGEISEVIMSPQGDAEAFIIDVGGFLGAGEKQVAIDFDEVEWTDREGEVRLVVEADKELLESAESFDYSYLEEDSADTAMSAEQPAAGDEATEDDTAMTSEQPATGDEATQGDTAMTEQPAEGETAAEGEATADSQAAEGDKAQDRLAEDSTEDAADVDERMSAVPTPAPAPGAGADDSATGTQQDMAQTESEPAEEGVGGGATLREGYAAVPADQISTEELVGTRVYGVDDANIGDIGDVILDESGQVVAYVINVGGFLGLGEKPVALASEDLEIMQDENGNYAVFTQFTEEQLENHPEFSEEAFQADPDSILLRSGDSQ